MFMISFESAKTIRLRLCNNICLYNFIQDSDVTHITQPLDANTQVSHLLYTLTSGSSYKNCRQPFSAFFFVNAV